MELSETIYKKAEETARQWQSDISQERIASEKSFHEMMKRMLKNPKEKLFLIELLDQSFRSDNPKRIADQLQFLFNKYGRSEMFSTFEQFLLGLFRSVGVYWPSLSVPMFVKYLREDISSIVIKGESKALHKHLQERKAEGTRVNINIIGESVLGEQEAESRIVKYCEALQNPYIDYISIKISTIFSQITPLAHEWTVEELTKRLARIYREAMANAFTAPSGEKEAKFVNLDMEEYRDLHLTVDAFKRTLEQEEFHNLHAGIVMQAYLPDTFEVVKDLAAWAKARVEKGGAPIKIRLVKGANQEMELTEASLRQWECVTYLEKRQSDANYKVIMEYLLREDVAPYVHTGVASHNLFDQALAWELAKERNVTVSHTAEMLEGMSETAYRHLKNEGMQVILYAPIATAKTFTNAIAYLVRRFDENTAQQNFLRHSFGLSIDTPQWDELVTTYRDSIAAIKNLPLTPYRIQDRNKQPVKEDADVELYRFENCSDTDFSLPQNRKWAEGIKEKWQHIGQNGGYHAVPVIGGEALGGEAVTVYDKSQYHEKKEVGSYIYAQPKDLKRAVEVAQNDPDGWRTLSAVERQKILMDAAYEIEKRRGDLIGIAAAEVGKVFMETDVEVSEAIDFLNFYPYAVRQIEGYNGIETRGKGVGLVISPWNFPVAIPVGGVVAALAAGNTVILKPASDSILCAYMLCEALWAAGVGKNTLQFAPSSGKNAGENLVKDDRINFTIFTGGEQTAYELLRLRPGLFLSAETGGKDATIVTSMADRDQAVKNVVASAFNNSGQKCSATSLLVLERELYRDENFVETLMDAAQSLNVGSVWDFQNRIGTLSNLPAGNLAKALEYLDSSEKWLIEPSVADENPYMLKPAIRYGTRVGDFCHMHELFGPVLSIMEAQDLDEAIETVNATGYGLTSGLESLDEREKRYWEDHIKAGNLYINRVTTGAIVLRQPFGGMGKSAIGTGRKAGGLNYVSQFMHIESNGHMLWKSTRHEMVDRLEGLRDGERLFSPLIEDAMRIASHFATFLIEEFDQEHDYAHIRGERNRIRYLGVESVLFRFDAKDDPVEMMVSVIAAKMAKARVTVSLPKGDESAMLSWFTHKLPQLFGPQDRLVHQDLEAFAEEITTHQRIRIIKAPLDDTIYNKASKEAQHIAKEPFVAHGRIELMHYFLEQSVSDSYHRYGNLGLQGLKLKGVL